MADRKYQSRNPLADEIEHRAQRMVRDALRSLRARLARGQTMDEALTATIYQHDPDATPLPDDED